MIFYISYAIIFGFLITAAIGLIASWIDRKVTARVQYRVGPPFYQPFADILKLFSKETLIPRGSHRFTFLSVPVVGFASVVLVSTILWINNILPTQGFVGDLIVAMYLFTIPSLSLILGGFASANPLASIGASREMKLILSYELPLIIAIMVPVIKAGYTIRLGEIIKYQIQNGSIIGSLSGVLAFMVGIISIQAKLGLVPFDIAEAETEITEGPLIEYSGAALGLFKLMKNMLLFALPFYLIILFTGGLRFQGIHLLLGILKYVGIVALITVIRNTNPRLRIDQAIKFFWIPVTVISIIAVILALLGV